MKGLMKIPGLSDLTVAYDHLLVGKVTPAEFALWTQWCRFDPRLAEILVTFLARHWKTMDLFALRAALLEQPWPQAFGVLAENVIAGRLVNTREVSLFRRWTETLLSEVTPAPNELFFLGTRKIGKDAMFRDVSESSQTYRRWGYFGRDLLVNKADPSAFPSRGATLLPAPVRRKMLEEFAQGRSRFTVHDYQAALDYRVSRRQAELDLAQNPKVAAFGNTRARFYRYSRRSTK